jgi:YD repeat-containing protein
MRSSYRASRIRAFAQTLRDQFLEATVTTEHLAEGIAADYDAEGRLAGIEILDALKRFGGPQTLRQVILEDVGLVRA